METVTIPKKAYAKLRKQAHIDIDILQQLVHSFKDMKEGGIRRVR